MEEFMASPTAVLLAWVKGNEDKVAEWTWEEYFDAGRMAVCMEVLSSLRTLRSFDSEEYGYALAVGALEGVLARMGTETKAHETYDALSKWRRERAKAEAYVAAGIEGDDSVSAASVQIGELLLPEDTLPLLPQPRNSDADPSA